MEKLTDIESIINSQSWKKSKTSIQPSASKSLKFIVKSKQSPECVSMKAFKQKFEAKVEAAKNESSKTENGRITELAKLAVPYKTLTEAVGRTVTSKTQSVLVPTFPMRKFGCAILNSFQPVFQKLDGKELADQEICFIKKSYGRAKSIKPKKMPGLLSPRGSKEKLLFE